MWVWIISLIILIACVIFAYHMIVSSYEFLPADKRYFWKFGKSNLENSGINQNDSLKTLNKKLQAVEDNSTFYQIQFTKFQERLKALETQNIENPSAEIISRNYNREEEEDWKEMYYEENEVKEKLENELDIANQLLEETKTKLKELSEKALHWVEMQSNNESRLLELQSKQNQVELLQKQLIASTEREKELEQLLITEITVREKYSMLQKEYIELQSEADDLRRRMIELNKKDLHLEMRLLHLNELESKLAICEQEKSKLKSRLENHLSK